MENSTRERIWEIDFWTASLCGKPLAIQTWSWVSGEDGGSVSKTYFRNRRGTETPGGAMKGN